MQTNLEKNSIESRNEAIVRNDYDNSDVYSSFHSDALSNGDPLGKGTGMGAHTHTVPGQTKDRRINYSDFDTTKGGGLYDIEGRNGVGGRNFLQNISLYNESNQYGAHLIDTSANDGQVRL